MVERFCLLVLTPAASASLPTRDITSPTPSLLPACGHPSLVSLSLFHFHFVLLVAYLAEIGTGFLGGRGEGPVGERCLPSPRPFSLFSLLGLEGLEGMFSFPLFSKPNKRTISCYDSQSYFSCCYIFLAQGAGFCV